MICPSCHEPLNYPSGDGCAAMKLHKEEVTDLSKFLRTSTSSAYNKTAADRIEELERYCAAYAKADRMAVDHINTIEAKLEKAVEALQVLSCKCTSNCYGCDICPSWTIRTVLAELEGKE